MLAMASVAAGGSVALLVACGAAGAPAELRDALDAAAAGIAEFHAIDGTSPRDEAHLAAETDWRQDPDFPVRIVGARDDGSYCLESAPAAAWTPYTSYGGGPGLPDADRTWHLSDGDVATGRCPS